MESRKDMAYEESKDCDMNIQNVINLQVREQMEKYTQPVKGQNYQIDSWNYMPVKSSLMNM